MSPKRKRAADTKAGTAAITTPVDTPPAKRASTRKAPAAKAGGRGKKADAPILVEDVDLNMFSVVRCGNWFMSYLDESGEEDVMDITGIEKLCDELGIDTGSTTVLALAWKLNASRMGYFSKAEWIRGMNSLNADTIDKLRNALPVLDNVYKNPVDMKELYKWSFGFAKEQDQKCLDVEVSKSLWKLMPNFAHVDMLVQFLEEEKPVKVINKDQWMSFYDFSTAVKEDLTSYDDTSAWPVLFDEYVEWRRQHH
ncbi:DCN1-like protein 4 [Chytridiales sp. JEL 0842]|nr:DCN1-like protein 4 [Chytridiales sp. JEL 0842]